MFDRDFTSTTPDPLWRILAEKQAWVPDPQRAPIVGDRKKGPDFYRTLTPDEFYDYVQDSGQAIRDHLEPNLEKMADMTPEQAKRFVDNITAQERRKALRQFH